MTQDRVLTSRDYDEAVSVHRKKMIEKRQRLAALQQEQEVLLRELEQAQLEEEANEKAHKKQLYDEQRRNRQQIYRLGITDHVIRGIRETALDDIELSNSIESVAKNKGSVNDVSRLLLSICAEALALDQNTIHDIAAKILSQSSDDDDRVFQEFACPELVLSHPKSAESSRPNAAIGIFSKSASCNTISIATNATSQTDVSTAHDDLQHSDHGENLYRSRVSDSIPARLVSPAQSMSRSATVPQLPESTVQSIKTEPGEASYLLTPKSIKRTSLHDIENAYDDPQRDTIVSGSGYRDAFTELWNAFAQPEDTELRATNTDTSPDLDSQSDYDCPKASTQIIKRPHDEKTSDHLSARPIKRAKIQLSPIAKEFEDKLQFLAEQDSPLKREFDCCLCGELPVDPKFSPCKHLYCSKCLLKVRNRKYKHCERHECDHVIKGKAFPIQSDVLAMLKERHNDQIGEQENGSKKSLDETSNESVDDEDLDGKGRDGDESIADTDAASASEDEIDTDGEN